MSMGSLIEKFRSVGLDRLERMNALLVKLEREPQDSEGVEELLREIHTIKGEAKMMGFVDINLVAHQTENVLMDITDDEGMNNTDPVDLVFEGLDLMRGLLTKSAGDQTSTNLDLTGFVDRVAEFIHRAPIAPEASGGFSLDTSSLNNDQEQTPEQIPEQEPDRDGPDDEPAQKNDPIESAENLKSPENVASPEDVAPPEKAEPDEKPPPAKPDPGSQSETGRSTKTRIKAPISEEQPAPGDLDGGSLRIKTSATLRVDVEKLERIGDIAGETLLMSRRLGYRLGDLNGIRRQLRDLFKQIENNLPKTRTMALRNLIHRFDACETEIREENYLVNLRASQLDDQVRHLRHIPLAQVLSHYPRAVRDLANSQGKKVRLIHTFGNVEVDRTILSALSEPLLHLVRNAVDHGIEPPEERAEKGKEAEGEIILSADYVGDSIRVVLTDDGRGIDPSNIRQRAEERKFLPADKARQLSDQEAIALIFEPGFTTQKKVSDVSGRGIGMNVVRRQITRIGGFIEIESEIGQGTTFTLHLPVSSAVSSVLVFAIADSHFALTAKDVERVAMVARDSLKKVHGGICVKTEDGLLPLVDWAGLLELDPRGRPPDPLTVLLVRKGARRVAIWVDDVIGEREAISRPLGDFLSGVRLCRGVALTDSGAVVPLLNVVNLIERSTSDAGIELETPNRQRSFTAVEGRRALSIKTVLVVEDSEVTRSLVVSILKNQGYRVLEADDGNHGWTMLQRHRVDLLLTDIQMPGMNGLELLQHVRGSEKYKSLPVVILTTLGGAADKKKAMSLGANGYLGKLSFQEQDLIDTVKRYLG